MTFKCNAPPPQQQQEYFNYARALAQQPIGRKSRRRGRFSSPRRFHTPRRGVGTVDRRTAYIEIPRRIGLNVTISSSLQRSKAVHVTLAFIYRTCVRYTYRFSPGWDGFFFFFLLVSSVPIPNPVSRTIQFCRAPRDTLRNRTTRVCCRRRRRRCSAVRIIFSTATNSGFRDPRGGRTLCTYDVVWTKKKKNNNSYDAYNIPTSTYDIIIHVQAQLYCVAVLITIIRRACARGRLQRVYKYDCITARCEFQIIIWWFHFGLSTRISYIILTFIWKTNRGAQRAYYVPTLYSICAI